MGEFTTNGLYKPDADEGGVAGLVDDNWDLLDPLLAGGGGGGGGGATSTLTDLSFPGAGGAVSVNMLTDSSFRLTVTDTTGFTINSPSNSARGDRLLLVIKNSSGGAMGTITWGGSFKLAGTFINPASTKQRLIEYIYDGTNWLEITRTGADV
jgi:hypothetical protein